MICSSETLLISRQQLDYLLCCRYLTKHRLDSSFKEKDLGEWLKLDKDTGTLGIERFLLWGWLCKVAVFHINNAISNVENAIVMSY